MLGYLITVLGAIAAYRLWGDHTGLGIIAIVATLYLASSHNEMMKEVRGQQEEDKVQARIAMIGTIVIIGLLIYSFVI